MAGVDLPLHHVVKNMVGTSSGKGRSPAALGIALKARREALEIHQKDIASRLNVTERTVSRMERLGTGHAIDRYRRLLDQMADEKQIRVQDVAALATGADNRTPSVVREFATLTDTAPAEQQSRIAELLANAYAALDGLTDPTRRMQKAMGAVLYVFREESE